MTKYILCLIIFLPVFAVAKNAKKLKKKEKALIESGNPNDTLRVLLITHRTDSLFLRKECKDVNLDKDLSSLIYFSKRLKATMVHPKNMGVGIAAPQVGLGRNIICVQRFDKEDTPNEIYLNPQIISCSDSTQTGPEGCLSIPNEKGEVIRHQTITIDYFDLDGKKHIEVIEGFTAVIFQHEIDHLRGILFTDHVKGHGLKSK
ncbi:MAG: peptide deformylase [Salibacteraceae bacterium]